MQNNSNGLSQPQQDEYASECVRLKYCLDIVKLTYEQETNRSKSIRTRSENIVKYSTLFVAISNLVVSLINNNAIKTNSSGQVKVLYIFLMMSIVISIILALISQGPIYLKMFPDGKQMLTEVKDPTYEYENARIYDLIMRYIDVTESMSKTNDKIIKSVQFSYALYVISIILLTWILIISINI